MDSFTPFSLDFDLDFDRDREPEPDFDFDLDRERDSEVLPNLFGDALDEFDLWDDI